MDERHLAALIATFLLIIAIALCVAWVPHGAGRSYMEPLRAHDRYLLTPEQQRVLVRDGSVSLWLNGREHTFYNTQEMKPYLNEGGVF